MTANSIKYESIMSGKAEIVSDEFMDWLDAEHPGHNIRTAMNAKRCGVKDAYVAFIGRPTFETRYDNASGLMFATISN